MSTCAGLMAVVKRDGSLEPFQPAKLRRCLALALRPCECEVAVVSAALARAVAYHLAGRDGPRLPSSAYIYRCAQSVLRQTGLSAAARRLAAHRRRRLLRRRRLRIFDPRRPQGRPARWRKADVLGRLQGAYGLRRPAARILAGGVEQRVLRLGYRLVSAALVEEVIRNELACWGLSPDGAAPRRGGCERAGQGGAPQE